MILISNQPVRLWTVTSHSVMKRKGKRLLILKMLFQYLKNGKRYVIPCCLFYRKIQLIMSCRSNRRILLNVSTALAVFLVSPKWTAGLLEGLRKSSVAMAILGFAAVMRPRLPSLIRSESGTPWCWYCLATETTKRRFAVTNLFFASSPFFPPFLIIWANSTSWSGVIL